MLSHTPQPLVSPGLIQRVANRLRDQIIKGEFSPGQRLLERELSESLAVSRNTLREVFRILASDGLLKYAQNRGVFVAIPTAASIMDIYRVRRLIECQALAGAYPHHPAREKMQEAVETGRLRLGQEDWPGVGTANMVFHMAIVELADSERLNRLFTPLLAELRLTFAMLQDPKFLHQPFLDRNEEVLALTTSGEFARAALVLNDYLTHSERLVLAIYARHQDVAAP